MAKKSEVDNGSMLSKQDIEAAIEESQFVKRDYPAFWKFYEMLLEMNNDLSALQDLAEEKYGSKNRQKGQ